MVRQINTLILSLRSYDLKDKDVASLHDAALWKFTLRMEDQWEDAPVLLNGSHLSSTQVTFTSVHPLSCIIIGLEHETLGMVGQWQGRLSEAQLDGGNAVQAIVLSATTDQVPDALRNANFGLSTKAFLAPPLSALDVQKVLSGPELQRITRRFENGDGPLDTVPKIRAAFDAMGFCCTLSDAEIEQRIAGYGGYLTFQTFVEMVATIQQKQKQSEQSPEHKWVQMWECLGGSSDRTGTIEACDIATMASTFSLQIPQLAGVDKRLDFHAFCSLLDPTYTETGAFHRRASMHGGRQSVTVEDVKKDADAIRRHTIYQLKRKLSFRVMQGAFSTKNASFGPSAMQEQSVHDVESDGESDSNMSFKTALLTAAMKEQLATSPYFPSVQWKMPGRVRPKRTNKVHGNQDESYKRHISRLKSEPVDRRLLRHGAHTSLGHTQMPRALSGSRSAPLQREGPPSPSPIKLVQLPPLRQDLMRSKHKADRRTSQINANQYRFAVRGALEEARLFCLGAMSKPSAVRPIARVASP
mmetsp:Transcript_106680/g.183994  ORF Transcript_106680/g.183994 Transcript_106680/m.183994 type:complete len:527 (-) Transcript_106680:1386-2966(-)